MNYGLWLHQVYTLWFTHPTQLRALASADALSHQDLSANCVASFRDLAVVDSALWLTVLLLGATIVIGADEFAYAR
jgi:hypothetical protein